MSKSGPIDLLYLKKSALVFPVGFEAQVLVGQAGGHPAPGSPVEKALLDEKGFVKLLDGVAFLADAGGQGVQADRSPVKLFDDGQEDFSVQVVQAEFVDGQHLEALVGHPAGNDPVGPDLGEIPDPPEQAIGHPGGAS